MFPKNKKQSLKKILLTFLLAIVLIFSYSPSPAKAGPADWLILAQSTLGNVWGQIIKPAFNKMGSSIYHSTLSSALNKLAYDSATYVASGKKGQKELFVAKEWEDYFKDVAMSASAEFIENMASEKWPDFMEKYNINLCEPKGLLKVRLGLGLVNQERPEFDNPRCDFDEVVEAYDKGFNKPPKDYLKSLTDSMSMNSSDLGVALKLNNEMLYHKEFIQDTKEKETASKDGWLDVRNIAGKLQGPPGEGKETLKESRRTIIDKVNANPTGEHLVDATNIFLNQLAAELFKKAIRNLTGNTPDDSELDYGGLLNTEEGPYSQGVSGAKERLSSIKEPQFDEGGDYEVLADLSSCPNNEDFGVGPNNCVIDSKFRQAIENEKTVAEALEEGYLKGEAIFGFKSGGSDPVEPRYNEGYPYRSLLILRKYRIIPVTWELAAEYIRFHQEVRNHANLNDLVACYDPEDSHTGYNDNGNQKWCQGLIDPKWVLKAPMNYCGKEGYGPQIINENVINEESGEKEEKKPAKLIVTRMDNYCGDEQSCVKEGRDGSCQYFGYCTRERRKWDFASDSCDPIYNTCQTFKSEGGETVSYLKNTINYCSSEDYGCEKYSTGKGSDFYSSTGAVSWENSSEYLYLNKEAEPCDSSAESCNQYIRIASGLGANLIYDGGFENNPDWINWDNGSEKTLIRDAKGRFGNILEIESESPGDGLSSYDRSGAGASIMPEGFVMEPETSYTLSADIYIDPGGEDVVLSIGRQGEYWEEKSVQSRNNWTRASVTIKNNQDILANQWRIYAKAGNDTTFYIDDIKLEIGGRDTPYSRYAAEKDIIYEKTIPDYLESSCYKDAVAGDYTLKEDALPECGQFARKCNPDEAGCEIFTDASDGTRIPAKVGDSDYCVRECVGYDNYIQEPTDFISRKSEYLIPETARSCSAESAGCEEFTNLDESEAGAEKKVYYSHLRQCVKPGFPGADCASFYSWQSDEEEGQQLVTYRLTVDDDGNPETAGGESGDCGDIYGLPPTDPRYDPDCREFYNRQGQVSYRFYSQTISCTEDCHPLRLTRKNIDRSASVPSDCSGHWDADENRCYVCSGGGEWSEQHQACIYKAVLDESRQCSPEASGCKEYNGNQGGDTRVLFVDSFENGSGDWTGGAISLNSTVAGENSFEFSGSEIEKEVGLAAQSDSNYALSFIAKGVSGGSRISAYFDNGSERSYFKGVDATDRQWQIYTISLSSSTRGRIGHGIADDEKLVISGESGLLIDNIKLTQINDRYYLVQDSWNTPSVCDTDVNGNPHPYYMAGCGEYRDRFGNTHYLHSFTQLCRESAAGCETVIDTSNYSPPEALNWEDFNTSALEAQADRVAYVVYDPEMACNAADKGCQRLGRDRSYGSSAIYRDVFLKNDPDKYEDIACDLGGVGCDRWSTEEGDFYFKDPGDMVCEYKQKDDGSGWAWFKKKVKRCLSSDNAEFGTGKICLSDRDCGIDDGTYRGADSNGDNYVDCLPEKQADLCPVQKLKTIGVGGQGNEVLQPAGSGSSTWAGLCPASQSGCAEYIDPVSSFNQNILSNPDLSQDIDGNNISDYWITHNSQVEDRYKQNVDMEGNTLYVLDIDADDPSRWLRIGDDDLPVSPFYRLNDQEGLMTNTFADDSGDLKGASSVKVWGDESALIYLDRNYKGYIYTNIRDFTSSEVSIKKAAVSYQLSSEVDKTSCNGILEPENGCVIFNERTHEGSEGLASLGYNAENSYEDEDGSPLSCSGSGCDANRIIKVRPDRECGEWLACKSYIKNEDGQNVCFDIGVCNRLNELGECSNFKVSSSTPKENLYQYDGTSLGKSDIADKSGYSKVGYGSDYTEFKQISNQLYDLGFMDQLGRQAQVPNGGFELYDPISSTSTPGKPLYWQTDAYQEWSPGNPTYFSVIPGPVMAGNIGIEYPMVGRAFLRYRAGDSEAFPITPNINVSKNEYYFLSYYINTKDLRGASAMAEVQVLDEEGNPLDMEVGGSESEAVSEGPGLGWQVKVGKFNTGDNSVIRVRLGANEHSSGYIYADDVKIDPVLNISDGWDIRQTCKLYPEKDSLSCEYLEDSGVRQKGEYGYCLEYDRYPGDPNACLLWWPIDKVKGAGLRGERGQGYAGEAPLYQCLDYNDPPYIMASDIDYIVDEKLRLFINGDVVHDDEGGAGCDWIGYDGFCPQQSGFFSELKNKNGPFEEFFWQDFDGMSLGKDGGEISLEQSGGEDDARIPLQYGTNTISVWVDSETPFGINIFSLILDISYTDWDGDKKEKEFDFTKAFKHHYKDNFDPYEFAGRPTKFEQNGYNKFRVKTKNDLLDHTRMDDKYDGSVNIFNDLDKYSSTTDCEQIKDDGDRFLVLKSYYDDNVEKYELQDDTPLENTDFTTSTDSAPNCCWHADPDNTSCSDNIDTYDAQWQVVYKDKYDDEYKGNIKKTDTSGGLIDLRGDEELIGAYDGNMKDNGEKYMATTTFYLPEPACVKMAQTVSPDGLNSAWVERTSVGSSHSFSCNQVPTTTEKYWERMIDSDWSIPKDCNINTDAGMFGAIQPPEGNMIFQASPGQWDGIEDFADKQPLIYQSPDNNRARMGQVKDEELLQGVFAQSYGIWEWDSDEEKYVKQPESANFLASDIPQCPNNERVSASDSQANGEGDNVNCARRPDVISYDDNGNVKTDILVNGKHNIEINGSGFVNLTFNSVLDAEQRPLNSYEVDWGDDNRMSVSPGGMRSKPNPQDPHSVFHFYDYKQLASFAEELPAVNCVVSENNEERPYCEVIPRVKLRDNWGWCSEGRGDVPCPTKDDAYCAAADPAKTLSGVSCRSGEDSGFNDACPAEYPICMDGWEKLDGKIRVYME